MRSLLIIALLIGCTPNKPKAEREVEIPKVETKITPPSDPVTTPTVGPDEEEPRQDPAPASAPKKPEEVPIDKPEEVPVPVATPIVDAPTEPPVQSMPVKSAIEAAYSLGLSLPTVSYCDTSYMGSDEWAVSCLLNSGQLVKFKNGIWFLSMTIDKAPTTTVLSPEIKGSKYTTSVFAKSPVGISLHHDLAFKYEFSFNEKTEEAEIHCVSTGKRFKLTVKQGLIGEKTYFGKPLLIEEGLL